MAETLELKTSGVNEVRGLLAALPDRVANKAVKQSLAAAARVGRDALRAEARTHENRGFIASTKSGGEKVKHLADTAVVAQRSYGDTMYAAVGFSYPAGAAGWLVEKGHRMVTHGTIARLNGALASRSKKTGARGEGQIVGQVAPHPIAAPAFESVLAEMQAVFAGDVAARSETALMELVRQ